MIQWILDLYTGEEYRINQAISWHIGYGLGAPCDSFQLLCPWMTGQETILEQALRIRVLYEGELVFVGVVDEWEVCRGKQGQTLELNGRGMQALLLDNEALGADFGAATLDDILSRYVVPLGIQVAERGKLPFVQGFSVKAGSSCWQVLYQFARYHGGVTPRFDRKGRLLLSLWKNEAQLCIDDHLPVKRLVLRGKRYGVLSQVQVQNRTTMALQTVRNEEFIQKGGACSRVLTVPRNTGYQSMRYTAQFQLEQSKREQKRVEVVLALPFAAWPGDVLELALSNFDGKGQYRILESRVSLGESGYETELLLGDPQLLP